MVRTDRIPPTLLVLFAVSSVQFGGACAKTLFDDVGPSGVVLLRVLFAAVILTALWRPALRGRSFADWRLIAAYGVGLAAAGIVLLSDFGTADLDTLGVGLALLAGGFWAAYILLAARVGRAYPGGQALALGMAVGAVLVAPVGLADAGADLIDAEVLVIGLAVAILSSAIPYT